jgi:hypothetical protein
MEFWCPREWFAKLVHDQYSIGFMSVIVSIPVRDSEALMKFTQILHYIPGRWTLKAGPVVLEYVFLHGTPWSRLSEKRQDLDYETQWKRFNAYGW